MTGATSHGIGQELLEMLLSAGWRAVSVARPERAAEHARRFAGRAVDVRACDCAHLGDVRRLADRLRAEPRYARLSLMVHSLGVLHAPRRETAEGLEEGLAVNALAPWLLTRELMPNLAASGDARVVHVSSSGLKLASLDLADLAGDGRRYRDFPAYFHSKLVALHLMRGLQAEADRARLPVAINAVHPGLVRTDLGRHLGEEGGLGGLAKRTLGRALHHGLASSARAAAAPIFALATEERFAPVRGAFLEGPSPLKRAGALVQGQELSPWAASRLALDTRLTDAVAAHCARLAGVGAPRRRAPLRLSRAP